MATWFKLLPLEIKEFPDADIIEPDIDVGSNDHVIYDGEMSLELKKIYTLMKKCEEESERVSLDSRYCRNPDEKEKLLAKALENWMKMNCLNWIFWLSIREDYGLWQQKLSGMRKGWKLVWTESTFPSLPWGQFFGGTF